MRFAQPKSEKTRWPKAFLTLLHESYPDYELNRLARGTNTECLRRVEGLLHSQSTICYRGQYCHCFAVSLTPLVVEFANSPFWLGYRFDHNRTIFLGFRAGCSGLRPRSTTVARTAFDTRVAGGHRRHCPEVHHKCGSLFGSALQIRTPSGAPAPPRTAGVRARTSRRPR
jgi:hypothetical protein